MKAIRLEHFSLSTLFPLSLTIIPLSPKRILKIESLFPHRKLPLLRFPSFLVLNYKQIQETFTQPPSLLQISLCLSFQLWQLSLSLSLFFKLQPTKSTERKVKPHLKFHWHRIQLLLRFNPRVNNSSIDPIPIKLSLPIH